MLLTSILPWVIVFYLSSTNERQILQKNISRSTNEELHDLCTSRFYNLKKVKVLNTNGKKILKNWLMKFHLYIDKNENDRLSYQNHTVILRSNDGYSIRKPFNLRLCTERNNKVLLYKLEVVHYFKNRVRRSSSSNETNTLNQSWSSDIFEQKYMDEQGLEITVKVPRGGIKTGRSRQNRNHLQHRSDGLDKKTTVSSLSEAISKREDIMKTTTSPPTTTDTTSTITSRPLSESCQRYKITIESVIFWASNQLDKLEKGEIVDAGCETKVPTQ